MTRTLILVLLPLLLSANAAFAADSLPSWKDGLAYGPALGLPDARLGAFTPALYTQAKKEGWTVVSMKNDWKAVFPPEAAAAMDIDILLKPDARLRRLLADHMKPLIAESSCLSHCAGPKTVTQ